MLIHPQKGDFTLPHEVNTLLRVFTTGAPDALQKPGGKRGGGTENCQKRGTQKSLTTRRQNAFNLFRLFGEQKLKKEPIKHSINC